MENLLRKLTDTKLDKKVKKYVDHYLASDCEIDFLDYVYEYSSYLDENTYKTVRDYELLERVCNLLK